MTDSTNGHSRKRLLFLLAAIFASRLLGAALIWHIHGPSGFAMPDTAGYLDLAASLLHGSFSVGGTPELVRTPAYPLLLVPAVASRHPTLFGVFENLLLVVLSSWLIWKIVNRLFPRSTAGEWALLLYGLEPLGFLYSEKLLADLLFSTQLLVFLWLVLRFLDKPTFFRVAAAALALGVATYSRPVSLFLGLWLVPFFLIFPWRLVWAQRIGRAGVFVLVFAMALTPWIARNYLVADYPGFAAIAEENLYFYSAAAVQAKLEHKSFAEMQAELGWADPNRYFQRHPEQRSWSQAKILRFESTEARRIIARNWLSYVFIHLRGCAIVAFDPAATEAMKILGWYPENGGLIYRATDQGPVPAALWLIRHYPKVGVALFLLGAELGLYYVLALIGLRRLPLQISALFISLIVYLVLVSGSSGAVVRYRTPIMPLVCILAGVGIAAYGGGRHPRLDQSDPIKAQASTAIGLAKDRQARSG